MQLVEDHEKIEIFHPKACNEIPAYLKDAADKELARMLAGGTRILRDSEQRLFCGEKI